MTTSPAIRPYRSEDRPALDDICIRTAHHGEDSRPHYADPGVFPATFAAPYVHLEPDLAFVLDDGQGQAVGYILGAADTARFAEAFRVTWLPLVADRYPEPPRPPRTPDEAMAGLLHDPERMVLPELAAHPAHLHIDLLSDWQRRGYGRRLMRTLLQALHDRGVPPSTWPWRPPTPGPGPSTPAWASRRSRCPNRARPPTSDAPRRSSTGSDRHRSGAIAHCTLVSSGAACVVWERSHSRNMIESTSERTTTPTPERGRS